MQSRPQQQQPCPCGQQQAGRVLLFALCCGRWISGGAAAPDAEVLMRSRYTAFVLQDEPYLLATWHPRTRPAAAAWEPHTRWLGLEVRAHTGTDADHAQVEFVARCRQGSGQAVRLHERSRFVREEGRWYYVDGELL
ncbi:MAG: YchJ family protein [Ramlibacter sp.]